MVQMKHADKIRMVRAGQLYIPHGSDETKLVREQCKMQKMFYF